MWKEIHDIAMSEADRAAADFFEKYGEPMYCGFAWVEISECNKQPNKDFVKELSNRTDGRWRAIAEKNDYKPGYRISLPAYELPSCGWTYRQSMDIKEAACAAYAKVLREHGISATMYSRAD